MQLPKYVKKHPVFWKYIPVLRNAGGSAIYPFIFLNETIYTDLQKDKPHPKHIATLLHEEVHRERQRKLGWLQFGLKYVFSRSFRFDEELLAYKTTMREYKKHNIPFDIEKRARFLSGPLYLWAISYEKAKIELQKALQEA